MIFGSELDALLASSDEWPRDDDDRHDSVVDGHMVDGHMVESGLDVVLLSSSGGDNTNTNASRDHGEGVHLGMGGSSSGGGGAAVVTMIPQQQQQQEEGTGEEEEVAAHEEMKQDYQPQQQQTEGRDTDRSPGMVEVDGGDVDVDMVVVAGKDSARTDQPTNYPVSSSLHTTVQAVPQGAFDVNTFASTQHAPVTEGTSKPGRRK